MASDEISAEEAAEIIGVTAPHVRWYYRQGLLPARRLGERVLLFRREDVEKFQKPQKTGRPPKAKPVAVRPKPKRPKGKAES